MKKIIAIFSITFTIFACSKKEGNMIVEGQIKGLKKGTLYLQKMRDTVLVSVDSVKLLGSEMFRLTDQVDSPVMYYLTFDGNTTDKRILFFGEEGVITINDHVEKFGINPTISGSKNQEVMDKFNEINKQFQSERLEFIKKDFEAKKSGNEELIQKVEDDYKRLVRRRVLYTTNFAINNADFEAAPYIAITEMYDATFQMLDTVNKSLTPKVKKSVYGKSLENYLNQIKKSEQE
ncbi:DUF4369 domain-containing protein [Polaribacter gangjinensis]|uniref:Thiol:disulfide interchange protein n=1 Tax=Polaribacter gangjinensis TaxID=574710 RepID=A0A2S7W932_9FLAO|nr:DUF4369 domain-containing protein [Polaribacter gangjinensis]PQJ74093.1 thiol:disulfide interchange protein [Polaribacter gangjinensis]